MENSCDWDETNVTGYTSEVFICVFRDWCQRDNILAAVIGPVAILVNLVAAIGILLVHKKEVVTQFLLSLAVGDLINPLAALLRISRDFTCESGIRSGFVLDEVPGLFIYAIHISTFFAILLTSFAMAMDRLIAVMRPLRHRHIVTKTRAARLICCVWLLSIFCGFLAFLTALGIKTESVPNSQNAATIERNETLTYKNETATGHESNVYLKNVDKSFPVILNVLFGIACCVCLTLVIVYSVIFHQIRNHQKFVTISSHQKTSITRGVLTSLMIVGSFAICWLPFSITFMATSTLSFDRLISPGWFVNFSAWRSVNLALVLLNSIVDPIIYVSRNVKIRQALRERLQKLRCSCKSAKREEDTSLTYYKTRTTKQVDSEKVNSRQSAL